MNESQHAPVDQKPSPAIIAQLRQLPRLIGESWREDVVAFRNWMRKRRGTQVDYVVLNLSGSLPERAGPPRSFLQRQLPLPPQPLTIQTLNYRLQRIAVAENVRGVVIIMGDLTFTGVARIQNIRRAFQRLREAGKEVVVYSSRLDLAHYYVASAGDRLYAPPAAQFDVVGLYSEAVFLRDALRKVGIEAEVLQVSPYKTAGNSLTESDMTPEQRQQMEWLIDDTYDAITSDLAAARGLSQEKLKALIDQAPFPAEKAVQEGLLDAVVYEDQLPERLAGKPDRPSSSNEDDDGAGRGRPADQRVEDETDGEKDRHPGYVAQSDQAGAGVFDIHVDIAVHHCLMHDDRAAKTVLLLG